MANVSDRGEHFSHLLALELKGAISTYGHAATKVAKTIGVDYSTLFRYFKGERAIPADTFSDACEVIGVDPAELVDRAYKRLIREMGPYVEEDAAVVSLYTPADGMPLGLAAQKTKGYGPKDQMRGESD